MAIKFSWKNIKKYLWKIILRIALLVGLISGTITIVIYWEDVSNWISSVGNPLVNPIVRDIILFVLLVGLSIWLFLMSKKIRSTSQIEKIEDAWQFDWNPRHDFIIEKFIEKDMELSTKNLFEGYEEKFPEDSEKEFNISLFDLEESGAIKHTGWLGNRKLYVLKKKGRRLYILGLKNRNLEKFMGLSND